jgi:hypothetical protein
MTESGRFSLVRFVSDLGRDEAKNVGVILFAEDGYRGMRAIRPSAFSPKLREQGILDQILSSMAERVAGLPSGIADLYRWKDLWSRSLQLSEPRSTAIVGTPEDTLETLYRGLVATKPRRSGHLGKAEVLDKVVDSFRSRGARVRRSDYLQDYIFDAIVETESEMPRAVAALSFASGAREWTSVEKDAGHFLYASSHVDAGPVVVLQPPIDPGASAASAAYHRVRRWLDRESIQAVDIGGLGAFTRSILPDPMPNDAPVLLKLFGD